MAGEVFRVICGRRVLSGNLNANKTLAKFFAALFGSFFLNFCKKRLWTEFCIFFRYFNFDILLTVLDVFHVLCFVFGVGLLHKKGVCRRSLVLNCFNHFDSKSRVKFLVLCVVGALYHAIRMQTKPSRNFFSAFWEFPPNSCKKRLWAKFCICFGDFNLDISRTVLDVFQFLCFGFCRGFTS